MKFGDLTSVAHNLAASVSDGTSFLFGRYGLDIHGEALASPGGRVVVDFLSGRVIEGEASEVLRSVLADSPAVLADLGRKHGALVSDFKVLEARYGVDQVYGPHFTVIVEDQQRRRSEELYEGGSVRKMRHGH